jgi:uncharacterized protein
MTHYPTYQTTQLIRPSEERTWAVLAHGAALAAMAFSAGLLGFVGSLVIFLVHKDRGPFVRAHAANSLNIQITMAIWMVVAIPLILLLGLGLLILLVAPVIALVLHVVGLVKALNGRWWNPPLTPRFVR